MKRFINILLVSAVALSFVACTSSEPVATPAPVPMIEETPAPVVETTETEVEESTTEETTSDLADGTYTQTSTTPSNGFIDFVTITVEGGQIVSAEWDGNSEAGTGTKKEAVAAGNYDLTLGGSTSDLNWTEQSEAMCAELVAVQDPALIAVNSDGTSDAVASVTIHVSEFVELADGAIAQAK